MGDLTWENGPIRQIPGSHTNVQMPPASADECVPPLVFCATCGWLQADVACRPEWMRLSTLVGAPAGAGVFRDHRAWHGAPPPPCIFPIHPLHQST